MSAEGNAQVRLLDDGMRVWIANARRKFIAAGGYGFRLTAEEEAEIRAAGYEPAPFVDHWSAYRE